MGFAAFLAFFGAAFCFFTALGFAALGFGLAAFLAGLAAFLAVPSRAAERQMIPNTQRPNIEIAPRCCCGCNAMKEKISGPPGVRHNEGNTQCKETPGSVSPFQL